jgi:Na+-transporting NADH:ubiquinone oxidoreductase subunit A
MRQLTSKKGYSPTLPGAPSADLEILPDPGRVAVLPNRIPFITPRLAVREGDAVEIGSLLFTDKRSPRLQFLAPAAGTVAEVRFGPRRVIERVVIQRDEDEARRSFPVVDERRLGSVSRSELVDLLLDAGVWPLLRALPFRAIASPDADPPPTIVVSLTDRDPFQPAASVYLDDRLALFDLGLTVLGRLADGPPVVAAADEPAVRELLGSRITHLTAGPYPAGDPGLVIYQTKTSAQSNVSWTIAGQDLLTLAEALVGGKYPTRRIVSVGGTTDGRSRHFSARWGAPLQQLVGHDAPVHSHRLITGGLFRGYRQPADGFLGYYETAVLMLPEGDRKEFLALFNPGWRKPSYSRAYLSTLNSRPTVQDCNRHGGVRACIACMHCADVCPVDILPQMAYKAVLADEVEEYLAHGLLDCLECGLCSWVCPAKIELTAAFKDAKADYRKNR